MRHFHSASSTKSDQWYSRQMVLQHIKPHNGGLTIPRDNGQHEYLTTLAGNDVQHATEGNRAIATTQLYICWKLRSFALWPGGASSGGIDPGLLTLLGLFF
jgi:hypothetical protein